MDDRHHVAVRRQHFRQTEFLILQRQIFSGLDFVLVGGPQRCHQLFVQTRSQTVRKCMNGRNVDGNAGWLSLIDDLTERRPLRIAIDLFAGRSGVPVNGIEAAIRLATQSKTLHSSRCALVKEDIDGGPASGKNSGRDQREEGRVLSILAAGHNPHLDIVLPHEGGQVPVQAQTKPLLLNLSLLAERGQSGLSIQERREQQSGKRDSRHIAHDTKLAAPPVRKFRPSGVGQA